MLLVTEKTCTHVYAFDVVCTYISDIVCMCFGYWCMCTCMFICMLLVTERTCTHDLQAKCRDLPNCVVQQSKAWRHTVPCNVTHTAAE